VLAAILVAGTGALAAPEPALAQESSATPQQHRGQETDDASAQVREPEAIPATEEFQFRFYGRLKADASLDTALVDPGNFARWVESPDLSEEHTHFNLTVRESRLGFDVTAPGDGPSISGHVEVDFYGGGAENRNVLMLRHAHIDIDWDSGWSLLAGQYSDVISPLAPTTVNYPVAWWVGNIGYRRPQLRVSRRFGDPDGGLLVTAAVSRTIGDDFALEPGDSGVDSGRPTVQGRIAWEWRQGRNQAGFGVSGHQGVEDLSDDFGEPGLDYESWSIGLDARLPLGQRWLFKGEVWTGENLDDYLGGIAQGINLDGGVGVRSTGGWGSIEFRPARPACC